MKLAIFGSGKIVQEFLAITKLSWAQNEVRKKRRKFKQNTKSKPPTRILMSV